MTKREFQDRARVFGALQSLGFTSDECDQLRRISLTLRAWFTRECGESNEYASWVIERDGDEPDSTPYEVRHIYGRHGMAGRTIRTRIPDRETGARRRLASILDARNRRMSGRGMWRGDVSAYVQTDPRGAALYILRTSDVPEGADPSGYYTRGICVY